MNNDWLHDVQRAQKGESIHEELLDRSTAPISPLGRPGCVPVPAILFFLFPRQRFGHDEEYEDEVQRVDAHDKIRGCNGRAEYSDQKSTEYGANGHPNEPQAESERKHAGASG